MNTTQSGDIVTVLLVYRDLDDQHVISVGGVFASRKFAAEQEAKLAKKFPTASFNLVDAFLDARGTLYPGFRIHPLVKS